MPLQPEDPALIAPSSELLSENLMDIDLVQKAINRSRASVYRYVNTDPHDPDRLNLPYDPQRLNPELRMHKKDPLRFHPNEVARFARDVLRIKPVTIAVQKSAQTETNELLAAILAELKSIHQLLQQRS